LTKRLRSAERDGAYWKGQAEARTSADPAPAAAGGDVALDPNDFDSDADYQRALIDKAKDEFRREADKDTAAREAEDRARKTSEAAAQARTKYADFDEVALSPDVPVTADMFDAALSGDHLGDILYHLGKNPAEAARIAALPRTAQIREVGALEARLTADSNTPPATNAPPPPSRVGSGANPPSKPDSEKTRAELHKEWEEERLKRLGAK